MSELKVGNFEELRGGHRNLPGNGALPGPQPSRGVVQLARLKGRYVRAKRPNTIHQGKKR
jgi:hypothetical protein